MTISKLHLSLLALALGSAACSKQVEINAGAEVSSDAEAEPAPAAQAPVEDPEDVHVEGDHLVIDKKIHFAHDSDEILEDSFELLDHIAEALNNHTELKKVHVIGHTDSSGDDAHNADLSERRAKSVVAALQERKVTQSLDAQGKGESDLACTDDTSECHEQNRRVEFVVEQ